MLFLSLDLLLLTQLVIMGFSLSIMNAQWKIDVLKKH
jgi:hypothetical protein